MGRWQPLRGDLPAEVARLVRELRQYVDRCEMNTMTVAAKTGYSRSSWLRYLNGRRLPPWAAVAELGRLAQADAQPLRVLWESAAHAWTGERPAEGTGPAPAPLRPAADPRNPDVPDSARTGPTPAADRALPRGFRPPPAGVLAAVAACSLLAISLLVVLLLARPWDGWTSGTEADRPPAGAPSGAPAWPWPMHSAADGAAAGCRAAGCRGLDPYRERCDRDSVVVHRLRAYGRVLTLQYSPACRASWAEVDTAAATAGLRIATTGGDQQTATGGGAYTAMVASGPGAARATVVVHGRQLGVAQYDSWIDAVSGSV
ncbi:helix-turn-helix domain-containing protein [Streptomyces misionensis]|uniref:helix-turn-helix domain-containing protein n=1 Tax=Streptomyces misionensis TaxID=67331 RepID=UPI0033A7569B